MRNAKMGHMQPSVDVTSPSHHASAKNNASWDLREPRRLYMLAAITLSAGPNIPSDFMYGHVDCGLEPRIQMFVDSRSIHVKAAWKNVQKQRTPIHCRGKEY